MFTGIVEEVGTVLSVRQQNNSLVLAIEAEVVLQGSKEGDSIAVNGVCLTATSIGRDSFLADVMPETFRRSSLKEVHKGSKVNLERAMAADGRFGGHIVSGHVDGTGEILNRQKEDNAVWITIGAKPEVLHYIVEKGSVAIDGISLTVASVSEKSFQVSIIPHTGKETTLLLKEKGDTVNIECDIIGKYVEKLMAGQSGKAVESKTMTVDFLSQHGFC